MTQEDKELLLKDLCVRLQYGVKCVAVTTNNEPNTIGGYCEVFDDFYIREVGGWFNISMIKPYLRPMSSMTEEERNSVENWNWNIGSKDTEDALNYFDWLNRHHFDYRGLIEKGLAIAAPEGMYNFNED